jgi:hypothetical protein
LNDRTSPPTRPSRPSRWRRPPALRPTRRPTAARPDRRALGPPAIKELWAFTDDRIAVRFAYEWHSEAGQWFRAYGNENWQFEAEGLMSERHASINDVPIEESEREFHWDRSGPRPADHPGLNDLGL